MDSITVQQERKLNTRFSIVESPRLQTCSVSHSSLQVFKEEMMHVFTRYINTHIQYNYRIFTMQICFLLSCITSYQEKLGKSRIPHLQAHILATGTHLAPRHIT